MTPQQTALVQGSFATLAPRADEVADTFYTTLFALDPALRPLFRADLQPQGFKLTPALALVMGGLDRMGTTAEAVRSLGRRHAGHGVRDEHYATVGAALLMTLRHHLGAGFDPAVEDAWAAAYNALAGVMQDAARQPETAAA